MTNRSAAIPGPLAEFFMFMGVPHQKLEQVVPTTIEQAAQMGTEIMSQRWFLRDHAKGDIFAITDALRDIRQTGGPDWELVCSLIDALPIPEDDEDSAELYHDLWNNLMAIRHEHEHEVIGPQGLEMGFRIWPATMTTNTTQATA